MRLLAAAHFVLVVGFLLFGLRIGAFAQTGNQAAVSLPEGQGRELVASRCATCHDLNTTVSKRATLAEWRDTVASMIERGAVIPPQEAATIASYLAGHYGPGSAPADRTMNLPDAPGKDVFMSKCFQCHNQGFWTDLRQDRRAWEGVLYRMVGRRALWTEDEINAMAEYLARVRGPK